jgi:hypothetical protein
MQDNKPLKKQDDLIEPAMFLQDKVSEMVYVTVCDITAAVRNSSGGVPSSIRCVSSCEVVIAWCHCVTCRVTDDFIFLGYPLVDGTTQFCNDCVAAKLLVPKAVLRYIDMFNSYAQENYGDEVDEYEEIY